MKINASLLYSVLYYNILDLCNDCFKAGKEAETSLAKSLSHEKRCIRNPETLDRKVYEGNS